MAKRVAALFVETGGAYFNHSDIEPWDINKNALNYKGDYPVVAHPPCQLWGRFAKINYARWGGDHNIPGNDGGCFKHALNCVRKLGGVLEHPASTYAWKAHDLIAPKGIGWIKTGKNEWVCEVWQSAYGHLARKKTWLFYCGKTKPKELNWERKDGTHQIGFYDQRGKKKNKPTLSGKKASATPPSFRAELIELARKSNI